MTMLKNQKHPLTALAWLPNLHDHSTVLEFYTSTVLEGALTADTAATAAEYSLRDFFCTAHPVNAHGTSVCSPEASRQFQP